MTQSAEHQDKVEAYQRAYQEHTETADDVTLARATARRVLRNVAWDEDGAGG